MLAAPQCADGDMAAMSKSEHADRAGAYLEDLCRRMDRGEEPVRGN